MPELTPIIRLAAGLACLMSATWGGQALAASGCQLRMTTSAATWAVEGYDPFSSYPATSVQQVTIDNSGGAPCDFDVAAQTDSEPFGLAGAGRQLPYSLIDNTDTLTVTPFGGQSSPSARAHLHLNPGAQQIIQYTFLVNLSDLPTDGVFDQHLLIVAESGVDTLAELRVLLSLQVAPSAVVSLRGAYSTASGAALIDLGTLQPGPVTTLLQLYVQSTGGYRLEADSQNHGELRYSGGGAWPPIDYSMTLGGANLDLSQSHPSVSAARAVNARQDLLPVGFVIKDTGDRRAGQYQDVITLTISPE